MNAIYVDSKESVSLLSTNLINLQRMSETSHLKSTQSLKRVPSKPSGKINQLDINLDISNVFVERKNQRVVKNKSKRSPPRKLKREESTIESSKFLGGILGNKKRDLSSHLLQI